MTIASQQFALTKNSPQAIVTAASGTSACIVSVVNDIVANVYVGASGVNSSNGMKISGSMPFAFSVAAGETVYATTDGDGVVVSVMTKASL